MTRRTRPGPTSSAAWMEERPNWNIRLRLMLGVVGLDVDNYGSKPGLLTITDHEKLWGPLPPAPVSTSRIDGSGIRFYRLCRGGCTGLKWPTGLAGVDIIRAGHRYAVVWPSIHTPRNGSTPPCPVDGIPKGHRPAIPAGRLDRRAHRCLVPEDHIGSTDAEAGRDLRLAGRAQPGQAV